ncbi:hypothetical protein VK70_02290 [Paenibacillus durus ATCC 35681]|uniref:Uncharacterized protein n=1 Tax=Paenibacillus durus ATCC 35681 TaxID=1333534 RepID=A0A0F7CH79_PAEDU|nr:hypothetical protein VK70_02290 [Paenibacillus durus ATCC 35681]
MKSSVRIVQICILVILTILCFIFGRIVIDSYDGELFSHSAVPIVYSSLFFILLVGIGITLGFLIKESTLANKIIIIWPWIHIISIVILIIVGQLWKLILGLLMYSIIVLPISLIGEGISLGFQINRLFFRRGRGFEIFVMGFINLFIVSYIFYEMSRDYTANLFM